MKVVGRVSFSILRIESESGWRTGGVIKVQFVCLAVNKSEGYLSGREMKGEILGCALFPLSHQSHLVIQLLFKP